MMRAQEKLHVQTTSCKHKGTEPGCRHTMTEKLNCTTLGTGIQAIIDKGGQQSSEEHVAPMTHKENKRKKSRRSTLTEYF